MPSLILSSFSWDLLKTNLKCKYAVASRNNKQKITTIPTVSNTSESCYSSGRKLKIGGVNKAKQWSGWDQGMWPGQHFNCSSAHSSVLCILHHTTDGKIKKNPLHNFVLSQSGFQEVERFIQSSHSTRFKDTCFTKEGGKKEMFYVLPFKEGWSRKISGLFPGQNIHTNFNL